MPQPPTLTRLVSTSCSSRTIVDGAATPPPPSTSSARPGISEASGEIRVAASSAAMTAAMTVSAAARYSGVGSRA